MAYGNCKNCGGTISWDEQKRKQLNTRRPLNLDGTIHTCVGNGTHSQSQPQQTVQQKPPVVDQKSADIKAAQLERKKQHIELIKNLQWNTKALATVAESNGAGSAKEILESMGFEEFREEQRSFEDDML